MFIYLLIYFSEQVDKNKMTRNTINQRGHKGLKYHSHVPLPLLILFFFTIQFIASYYDKG